MCVVVSNVASRLVASEANMTYRRFPIPPPIVSALAAVLIAPPQRTVANQPDGQIRAGRTSCVSHGRSPPRPRSAAIAC